MPSLLLLWPKSQGTIATKIANVNLTKTKKNKLFTSGKDWRKSFERNTFPIADFVG